MNVDHECEGQRMAAWMCPHWNEHEGWRMASSVKSGALMVVVR
jgi:hypothetical protein